MLFIVMLKQARISLELERSVSISLLNYLPKIKSTVAATHSPKVIDAPIV